MQIVCHGLKDGDFSVEFSDHKVFLGRDESNSIVVAADGISRFHAVLIEDGDELYIKDNDSLNGTFLNYNPVRGSQKLVNGDIIQIGYRLIRVDFRPDEKVVLDFVPPEETEIVSQDSAKPPLKVASPEPNRTMVSGDDIAHTMVASETMLSRSSKPDKSLLPGGSEIGKYVIIKRLGKGGMGEVYLAKHKTLGICRALKLLSKDSGDNDTRFLERFIREAKLASEIRHPNVVGVMDVETDSDCGFPYIVMEYVDGGSLRNSLTASVRLSEEQAVVIVEAIASALQAAEEHNIVHRDIKPDNIMFTRRGEVKLADLGIAKVDGKDADLTKTNMMIGTPAYLPPEQAQNAKGVDARADIYSLGATFYEMLTGQQPYPGENSIEVLHKLFLTPVPDPRKINPAVSAASAAIVMKMMAKDPKNRFQNATELLAMLEKTFPPHTAQESAELIRKVIAGECQNNTSFSSNISMSRFSILWSRIPNKRFVIPVAGLVFAICVLCVLFPFLGKKPAAGLLPKMDKTGNAFEETGDVSAQAETYVLQIRTTPDSDIRFISPDGRMILYSADNRGSVVIPGLNTGKYRVRISKNNYRDSSYEFDLKKDLTLDLPLEVASADLPVKEEASAGKTETKTDIVFDLTECTENNGGSASLVVGSNNERVFRVNPDAPIVDDMKAFRRALSYTIQVRDDQPAGTYKLAGNAEGFSASMHLQVGNDYAYSVLTVGKPFIKNKKRYTLLIQDNTLILTIALLADSINLGFMKPDNVDPFLVTMDAACKYTVKVRDDQPLGSYKLAGNAINYNSSMHLQIGDTSPYNGVLAPGRTFIRNNKIYNLSIQDNILILTISPIAVAREMNIMKPNNGNPYLANSKMSFSPDTEEDFSYTVHVKENQASGMYMLAKNATGFHVPVTLQIDATLYPGVLSIGNSFTIRKKSYSLSLNSRGELILTIRKN